MEFISPDLPTLYVNPQSGDFMAYVKNHPRQIVCIGSFALAVMSFGSYTFLPTTEVLSEQVVPNLEPLAVILAFAWLIFGIIGVYLLGYIRGVNTHGMENL